MNESQERREELLRMSRQKWRKFVMVSQKNVTGLDGSSVVPEFIDYLSIHVD